MKEMKNTRHFIRTITLFLAIAMLGACCSEVNKVEENTEVSVGEEEGSLEHDAEKEPDMSKIMKIAVYEKPRVINITDLLADPDDEQSLVRMFVSSNMVDLEGIIVSTSCWRKKQDMS